MSMMSKKSFFAGAILLVGISAPALAEQVTIPNTFVAGTPARASEVNENFATLAAESNAQDLSIAALQAGQSGEQLLCTRDPRPSKQMLDDRGNVVFTGFPFPQIRFRVVDTIASVVASNAICVSPSDPSSIIEINLEQLTAAGWVLRRDLPEAYVTAGVNTQNLPVYVFER